jgi:hypothetical protein
MILFAALAHRHLTRRGPPTMLDVIIEFEWSFVAAIEFAAECQCLFS